MPYLIAAVLVVIFDQWTKLWIMDSMHMYESREVIAGFFHLVYVTNTGAAFSFLADVDSPWRHYFFLGVAVVAVAGLTVTSWTMRRQHCWYGIALGLIAGGAIGNLIDRLRYGAVVDFLDFSVGSYHWPAFNLADSAICVGAAAFALLSLTESKHQHKRKV